MANFIRHFDNVLENLEVTGKKVRHFDNDPIIFNLRYAMRFLQSRKDDISFINTVCPEDYFDANGQKIYFFTSIFKG